MGKGKTLPITYHRSLVYIYFCRKAKKSVAGILFYDNGGIDANHTE
jgi:hypothetical protein